MSAGLAAAFTHPGWPGRTGTGMLDTRVVARLTWGRILAGPC
jgi:hypothetical protein